MSIFYKSLFDVGEIILFEKAEHQIVGLVTVNQNCLEFLILYSTFSNSTFWGKGALRNFTEDNLEYQDWCEWRKLKTVKFK